MVMVERYGIPPTRIISAMQGFQVPFQSVESSDRILVFTDDAMDPMVWQAAMAVLTSKGCDPTLCLYTRRTHHCADPTEAALAAAGGADAIVCLTTTALNSGTPGLKKIRKGEGGAHAGKVSIWLMEEITVEILTEGGGRANQEEVEEICGIQRRIGEIYDKSTTLHVTSDSGTDLTADISDMPFSSAERWGKIPFSRDPKTGRLGAGTWPFGEIHIEPKPDTANGTVVWDTTAHYPPGRWDNPVTLTIKDGWVTSIDGGTEADQIKWYLDKYGDEKSFQVGGEIALGTNSLCQPRTGMMRSEKKRLGAMHFGIGTGADRGEVFSTLRLEGITDRVTIVADNTVVCQDGKIQV